MKKLWILLLVVSSVIGMAVPGTANPTGGSNDKTITVTIDGGNIATNTIEQTLDNLGDQSNVADVATLVGDTNAVSAAEANADATGTADASGNTGNENSAEAEDNDAYADANAGDAVALGGIAASDVSQYNDIYQDAYAEIHNNQMLTQTVDILEWQDASVDIFDAAIVEDNTVDEGSGLDVDVNEIELTLP